MFACLLAHCGCVVFVWIYSYLELLKMLHFALYGVRLITPRFFYRFILFLKFVVFLSFHLLAIVSTGFNFFCWLSKYLIWLFWVFTYDDETKTKKQLSRSQIVLTNEWLIKFLSGCLVFTILLWNHQKLFHEIWSQKSRCLDLHLNFYLIYFGVLHKPGT